MASSKTGNKVLMARARQALTGRWRLAFSAFFVTAFLMTAIGIVNNFVISYYSTTASVTLALSVALSIIMSAPISFGIASFALALRRGENPKLSQLFSGFQKYGRNVLASFLYTLICFLWCLLLVIPGLIALYSYALIFYILADETNSLSPREALKLSKKLMQGNKWKLFRLHARFFGWSLFCACTFGVTTLWQQGVSMATGFWPWIIQTVLVTGMIYIFYFPYATVSLAEFYEDLKLNALTENDQKIEPEQKVDIA